MNASRQRIGDQRRAIIRNKLLPQTTTDLIYNQVREELARLENSIRPRQTQQQHLLESANTTYLIPTPNASSTQDSNTLTRNTNTRMKWTTKHNEAIIRSYFHIT